MTKSFLTIFSGNGKVFSDDRLRQWPNSFRENVCYNGQHRFRQSFPIMVRSFPTMFSDNDQIASAIFQQWPHLFRSFPTMTKSFPTIFSDNGKSFPTIVSSNGQIFSEKPVPTMAKSFPSIVSDNGQIYSDNLCRQWQIFSDSRFRQMIKSFPTVFRQWPNSFR